MSSMFDWKEAVALSNYIVTATLSYVCFLIVRQYMKIFRYDKIPDVYDLLKGMSWFMFGLTTHQSYWGYWRYLEASDDVLADKMVEYGWLVSISYWIMFLGLIQIISVKIYQDNKIRIKDVSVLFLIWLSVVVLL